MKNKVTSTLLSFSIALLLVVSAQGQQAASSPEEALIKQYREEIQLLVAKPPQSESLLATHSNTLFKLRQKLRDLLMQKTGALKKDIRDYQRSNSSAELQAYVNQLTNDLQGVDSEIQGLDRALGQAPPVVVTPSPSPSPTSSPAETVDTEATTEAPSVKANREAFEAEVANISPLELKEAAAPAEVAESEAPQPNCADVIRANAGTFSKFQEGICFLARDIRDLKVGKPPLPPIPDAGISLESDQGTLLPLLVAKLLKTQGSESFVSFITEAQEARTDQQVGAGPSAAGTTSLVSKGGVPFALGFAAENGAAVESRSDTTVTFRINPAGALGLFANKGFIPSFQESENDPVLKFLKKTSIGLTFDTSRGADPGVFTGDRQQLSAISARLEFVNERDPRLKKYEREWEQFVESQGVRLAQQLYVTAVALQDFGTADDPISKFKDPALQAWFDQTNGLLSSAGTDLSEIEAIIRKQVDLLPVDLVSDETVEGITGFAKAFEEYTAEKKRLLDEIAKGKVLTFEFTNKREVSAPDTSNFNFIAGTGTGRRINLTANGSLTIFSKRPVPLLATDPRPGRVRDFQFAGQVDVPFGDVKKTGQFVLWFSGRYERLMEDASTLVGTIVPNTKGDIAVGQFGLKIPIKGLGMSIPLSFTFANRTELVKEKEVRGNFGFTFNLDTLLSNINPF